MGPGLRALTFLVLMTGVPLWATAGMDELEYAGSERCAECHREEYAGWKETFHATVVQDARKDPSAILADFSVPGLGFSIEDVEYTIGGHWDQRYMKKIDDDFYVLPKLWNVQAQSWRPYNVWSWRKKPYSKYCKGCHVTAYDPKANVTEAEHRIGCEACHGPGWSHAETAGDAPIVNPRKLPHDRADMICAACHVRGRDPTATFFFPVGFVPGEDLGRYYVPDQKAEGESNSEAILRLFNKWETAGKLKCEVCGIFGAAKGTQGKSEKDETLDFCFGCHDFKDRYPEHNHHSSETKLVCFDCHEQQATELMNPRNRAEIHTYRYFLQHTDGCYDREIEKRCAKCHPDKDVEWARRTVNGWRAPVKVDH
jgi:hypothetical protein